MQSLTRAFKKLKTKLSSSPDTEESAEFHNDDNNNSSKMSTASSNVIDHNHTFLECCTTSAPSTTEPLATNKYVLIVSSCVATGAYLKPLWKNASYRVVVDGGVTKVFDAFEEEEMEKYLPDVMLGQLEKQPQAVYKFFQSKGVEPIESTDESTTDVEKALLLVKKRRDEGVAILKETKHVLLYTPLLNRFDKILNCFHLQAKFKQNFDHFISISEGMMAEVLLAGDHHFHLAPKCEAKGTHCGLFPLGAPVNSVHTHGLKYNLKDQRLAFGDFVSAANTITTKRVRIHTSDPLLFTTAFSAAEDEVVFEKSEETEPFVEKEEQKQEQQTEAKQD